MREEKRRFNNEGFSLIELIVVIAIMAILVGAMAPRVTKYIESARRAADVQALGAVFTAVQTTLIEADTNDLITGPTDADFTQTVKNGDTTKLLGNASFDSAVKSLLTGGDWPEMTSKALKGASGITVNANRDGSVSVTVTATADDVTQVTVTESGSKWTPKTE